MSVDNFSEKLLLFWQRAAEQETSNPVYFARHSDAVSFRHRLYRLRNAIKAEGTEDMTKLYNRLRNRKLRIEPTIDSRFSVTAVIADREFDKALDDSGVSIPAAPNLDDLLK